MPRFEYPISTFASEVSPSYVVWENVPPRVRCFEQIGIPFATALSETWDCNRCGSETAFGMPFVSGDIIPLQIQLPDVASPDPTGNSTDIYPWRTSAATQYAFGAELYDQDCNLIESFIEDFCSDYWTAWYEQAGSVQTLFVDTSTIASSVTEFQIKIIRYDETMTQVNDYWSEPFRRVNCEDTLVIESTYSKEDCLQFRHDTPTVFRHQQTGTPTNYTPTPFSWRLRVWATIRDDGQSHERTTNDKEIVLRNDITNNYELSVIRQLPPYFYEMLGAALGGQSVVVDDRSILEVGNIDKGDATGRMLLPQIQLSTRCEIRFFNCD